MSNGEQRPEFGAAEPRRLADLLAAGLASSSASPFASATAANTEAVLGPQRPTAAELDLPGYVLEEEIGRGGAGVVYRALQKSTKRIVAVKVMREGPFASRADKARFEREVEILGQLSHPNIVAIHDSGTAHGCFYFVMNYVAGEPMEQWLASGPHPIAPTLRLFQKICDAVNAAHVRGIIHRDLKPGNIRVDAAGEPHVLDFGLAKATLVAPAGADAQLTVMTQTGQFMGSLPWASPEQAEAVPGRIDTRTDVYALGVMLYQMLTGRFPYDVTGSVREVLGRVIHAEPARPGSLRRGLGNELETIVLKCLDKDRERRYQTAGELARDVRHFLAGEPIEAKRDSAYYMLRKQLRRYRVPLAVAGAFVVVIVAGLALYVYAIARETARYRSLAYRSSIAAAQSSYANRDTRRMKQTLRACPEELRGWEWSYLERGSDRSERALHGHEGWVEAVAFDPSGYWIASGGRDNTLRRWDSESGFEPWVLTGGVQCIQSISVDRAGNRLAAAANGGMVQVWDMLAGRLVSSWPLWPEATEPRSDDQVHIALHPDGRQLVGACGTMNWLEMWDTDQCERICKLPSGAQTLCVAYSPDGFYIAAGTYAGEVLLWDARRYVLHACLEVHSNPVNSVVFSHDGRWLASCGRDGRLVVSDVERVQPSQQYDGHVSWVRDVAFSPDDQRLASAGQDRTVRIWDRSRPREPVVLLGHDYPVTAIDWSSDGCEIVSSSDDRTLRLWNPAAALDVVNTYTGPSTGSSLAFSPDGLRVAVGGQQGKPGVWDAVRGTPVCLLPVVPGGADAVAFHPHGEFLATVGQTGDVTIWNARDGNLVNTLKGIGPRQSTGHGLAYSPKGRFLAAGYTDATVCVWPTDGSGNPRILRGHLEPVFDVAWSPDGVLLATASQDDTVRLWNLDTDDPTLVLKKHEDDVTVVVFSPDGHLLASGSNDGTIRFWDPRTGAPLRSVIAHEEYAIRALAFSPNGQRLASGSHDGNVILWDADHDQPVLVLPGHANCAVAVAWSPDGRRLGSCDEECILRIWTAADAFPP